VDETLELLERGRLTVPENVPLEEFVAAGGKARVVSAKPETTTARILIDQYLATHANGTIEENSLGTAKSHLNQFTETVGERFRIQTITLLDPQKHVDRRRKKGLSPVTLKKEVATVRACWNWAVQGGILKGTFPGKGLRFPKEEEKEPFRTFAEIEAGRSLKQKLQISWLNTSLPTARKYTQHLRTGMLTALTKTIDWFYSAACDKTFRRSRSRGINGFNREVQLS
jgi:site-specific recombinase XerD